MRVQPITVAILALLGACGTEDDSSSNGSNNGTANAVATNNGTAGKDATNNGTTSTNGACTAERAPWCEGKDSVRCEDVGGASTAVRTTCATKCQGGECVESWELCEPEFGGDYPCPNECDGSGGVIVDGESYCTARCGAGGECPAGTACDTSFNGGTCLPPCEVPEDCPEGFLPNCPESGFCGR